MGWGGYNPRGSELRSCVKVEVVSSRAPDDDDDDDDDDEVMLNVLGSRLTC